MTEEYLVVVFAALTVFISLVGGWLPQLVRMTHERTQFMMSLVAGFMLGVGLLHMLPHAAAKARSLDQAVCWMMAGLLTMFFLQRFLHFHQHEPAEEHGQPQHDHAHEHHPPSHAGHMAPGPHRLNWLGIAVGMTLHSLMDGVALAAAVETEAHLAHGAALAGLGTFVAIFLHKPLDAMSITALMRSSGSSTRLLLGTNFAFALVCPLGAGLFYLGLGGLSGAHAQVVSCALAFSAGMFVCIALADLLPEVQFHSHDRLLLSLALLLGVLAAWGIGFLEHEHLHDHQEELRTNDVE